MSILNLTIHEIGLLKLYYRMDYFKIAVLVRRFSSGN